MAANGRLPASDLAPIAGGQLRKDAAAAWNAMTAEARRRNMPVPMPDGSDSSYRSFDRQVFWKRYWTDRGFPRNAAEPGTSRHGLGIAVDVAEDAVHHAATIDAIGEKYGWSKKWSDAPWEPWHNTWRPGHYSGPDPGPLGTAVHPAAPSAPSAPSAPRTGLVVVAKRDDRLEVFAEARDGEVLHAWQPHPGAWTRWQSLGKPGQ